MIPEIKKVTFEHETVEAGDGYTVVLYCLRRQYGSDNVPFSRMHMFKSKVYAEKKGMLRRRISALWECPYLTSVYYASSYKSFLKMSFSGLIDVLEEGYEKKTQEEEIAEKLLMCLEIEDVAITSHSEPICDGVWRTPKGEIFIKYLLEVSYKTPKYLGRCAMFKDPDSFRSTGSTGWNVISYELMSNFKPAGIGLGGFRLSSKRASRHKYF